MGNRINLVNPGLVDESLDPGFWVLLGWAGLDGCCGEEGRATGRLLFPVCFYVFVRIFKTSMQFGF